MAKERVCLLGRSGFAFLKIQVSVTYIYAMVEDFIFCLVLSDASLSLNRYSDMKCKDVLWPVSCSPFFEVCHTRPILLFSFQEAFESQPACNACGSRCCGPVCY